MARRRARADRDPLIVELLAALGAETIRAGYLVDDEYPDEMDLLGICGERAVVINEAAHLVRTLVHELIHRIRPAWSEASVTRRTTQVMRQLSHAEIDRLYQVYCARRRATKRPRRC
jgi:hypothetical protein